MSDRIHTVGIVAFNNDKVLLVKHGKAARHITGVYGLPGGRIDGNETLLEAATREFLEETGLVPQKGTMMQISTIFEADIPRKSGETLSTYWNVFVVKNFSGVLLETEETTPEWVEINMVKKIEKLLPNTEEAIQEGLKLLKK